MRIYLRLLPWPCGCVADGVENPISDEDLTVFECKWCHAVITKEDFRVWFIVAQIQHPVVQFVYPLLRIREQLFEGGDDCKNCDTPLIKEVGIPNAKWGHLNVPMDEVEVLKN